jgi:hypothetical protein
MPRLDGLSTGRGTSRESVSTILVYIDPAYTASIGRVQATIETLLEIVGYRARTVASAASAQVRYGPAGDGYCAPPEVWARLPASVPIEIGDLTVPSSAVDPAAERPCERDIDRYLTTFFFLTGRHERGLEQPGQSAPRAEIGRWGVLRAPVVDALAAALGHELRSKGMPAARPRWPDEKRWALALSHDCDRPLAYLPVGYARDAARFMRRGLGGRAARAAVKASVSMFAKHVIPDPYARSALAFTEFERRHEMQGTYFFASWGRHDPDADARDLAYNHATLSVARLARRISEDGMELGLHSSIRAWCGSGRFALEAERFASAYGVRPTGLRAHWWSLEPGAHECSLRLAANAGFTYDSSFGMNERVGHRRGTAYPFRPFDPDSGAPTGLLEIPPTVMDDALPLTPEDAVASLRSRTDAVRAVGGVLVLDLHSDVLATRRWGAMAAAVLNEVSRWRHEDASCWFASLGEISDWVRNQRLK